MQHNDERRDRGMPADDRLQLRIRGLYAKFGDIMVDATRQGIRSLDGSTTPQDCAKFLILAASCFLRAGMTHKARAVGRWGELLRRAWAKKRGW